jgi:hypothetical protein
VLVLNYVPVFHVPCRNATTAIKTNHMMLPRINLLHINFTPPYLPDLLKSHQSLNHYELIEIG